METFLTVAEVADLLSVKPQFIYAHKAEFGYLRVGRGIRFDRRNLDRYVATHTTAPKCKAGRPRKTAHKIVRRISWEGAD
jgi:excisionase family DNA binding protein